MESKIAKALRLKFEPVAIVWSDNLPEDAARLKGCGGGCIISLFAQAAARGRTAAFDKENFGCPGGGVGLGFGRAFDMFPFGGREGYEYFLSTGIAGLGKKNLEDMASASRSPAMAENLLKGSFLERKTWRDLLGD